MHKSKGKHLLVIRLSAMGDVAMTIPVLLAFKRTYPDVSLTFLTKPFFSTMLRPLEVDLIHADVNHQHKGVRGLWSLSGELRRRNFDGVADLHNVLRTKLLKFFLSSTGRPFLQIDKGRKEKKQLTRPEQKVFKPLPSTVQRYSAVFDSLGYPITPDARDVLPSHPLPAEVQELIIDSSHQLVGVAPFAAHQGKQYPLSMMEEVVRKLAGVSQVSILLFGAPGKEAEILEKWSKKYESVFNMAGRFAFESEIATISNLDVMLAMDSGNAHIAAAYGISTVTLWGVTHPYAGFAPFNQPEENLLLADREKYPAIPTSVFGNTCPDGYERAMESIPTTRVTSRILEILDQARVRGAKDRM